MNISACRLTLVSWATLFALTAGPWSAAPAIEQAGNESPAVIAPDPAPSDAPTVAAVPNKEAQIQELKRLLASQSEELNAQRDRLRQQQQAIDGQQARIDEQTQQIEGQQELLQAMQTQIDQLATGVDKGRTDVEIKLRERLKTLEETVAEIPEAAEPDKDFTGSILIPGTNAAMRIGGFVKMSAIDSLDAIGTDDRFIVGTIPVSGDPAAQEDGHFVVSAEQTRLNLEMREKSSYGDLRAFVEADFAGSGDTFRLRHAFGQYRDLLAGKTWSTMVDTVGSPEEVDFEGINGRVKVRQAQFRYFPSFGRNNTLKLALEDPDPDVTDGEGKSQFPDGVISIQRDWSNVGRTKASLLLRQIDAVSTSNPKIDQSEFGWGLSLSNYFRVPVWNDNDRVMLQVNYGDGFGRYINDLGTVGGQDAVFNPLTGEMETLGVFAGYVSAQHWWNAAMRSTLTYSWVNVANKSFQPGDSYDATQRISMNLLWSPTPRIDVGGEFLWGERENKDGRSGKAKQLQFATKYRF